MKGKNEEMPTAGLTILKSGLSILIANRMLSKPDKEQSILSREDFEKKIRNKIISMCGGHRGKEIRGKHAT